MRRGLLRLISGQFTATQCAGVTPYLCHTHRVDLCVSVSSIFDDVGDYILSASSSSKPAKEKDRHRERERDREDDSKSRRHSYFEKPRGDEHQVIQTHTHT